MLIRKLRVFCRYDIENSSDGIMESFSLTDGVMGFNNDKAAAYNDVF